MIDGDTLKLDLRSYELKYIYGPDVTMETEDKSRTMIFEDEQFNKFVDDYRSSIGELTVEELENKILNLEREREDLKEQLEIKEESYDFMREKLYEGYPF